MPREIPLSVLFEERARTDSGYAIAYALLKLADAQQSTATWIKYLGNGDAAGTMGAIEAVGVEVKRIADALAVMADADHLFDS